VEIARGAGMRNISTGTATSTVSIVHLRTGTNLFLELGDPRLLKQYHRLRSCRAKGGPLSILRACCGFLVLFSFLVGTEVRPQGFRSQNLAAALSDSTAHIVLTVSDHSGKPVAAPLKDSVQLHIGRQSVEIEEIRSLKDSPLFFSVLVDVSGSSKQFADRQIAVASSLFRHLSTDGNQGYLILFNYDVVTSDRSLGASAAEEALRRFPEGSRVGSTALYDAVVHAAVEQLSSNKVPKDSRRAIFILSDGGDNVSRKSLADTLRVVQKEGIPIFSIGFSGTKGSDSPRELKRDLETLKALNEATGGWGTFLDEPGDAVEQAINLTDAQCLVSFKSLAVKPKKYYPLKVESSIREIHLLAPKEYFVQ
jgi:hypothetical protein